MRIQPFFLLSLVLAALAPLLPIRHESRQEVPSPGWPAAYQSPRFKEIPFSEREKRFAKKFPGRFGRFRHETREIVIRWLYEPTRKLHPAADCYQGMGYRIKPRPIMVDDNKQRWGAFTAIKNQCSIAVKERIYDSQGNSWTDVSAWYWAAILGHTKGPWWAVTIAEVGSKTEKK